MTPPGRALTLRQPYAEHVLTGHKTIENRGWNTGYRGLILIHSAKRRFAQDADVDVSALPRGAVIGIAELIDVHLNWHSSGFRPVAYCGCARACGAMWLDRWPYHLMLANPRRLPKPIHTNAGRTMLWVPPAELAAAAVAQLEGLA